MARRIQTADLVARALGALPSEERALVDRALEADPALRQRFEQIASHLLRYDSLPPAPPPPPFARIASAMDAHEAPDLAVLKFGRRGPRPMRRAAWAVAAVAVVALGLALFAGGSAPRGQGADAPLPAMALVPGRGVEVWRDGRALPAPARGARPLRSGDRLRCDGPAEARFGERVRLILDARAALRVDAATEVALEAGRAFFEVAPGPFRVRTPYGDVQVLGTAFEVDVRAGTLAVTVEAGLVDAAGMEVPAGSRWQDGRVVAGRFAAGAWFRRPRLDLEAVLAGPVRVGQPLGLRLVFRNPGNLPVNLVGPGAARTPVWIRFETADGALLGELPVLSANVEAGQDLLRPGRAIELAAGEHAALTVRILPPFGSPGAYRCKALYRPEDPPAVLSSSLEIEVR